MSGKNQKNPGVIRSSSITSNVSTASHRPMSRAPSTASTSEYDIDDSALPIPDDIELGPIITALKLGTSMTKFAFKKRPEQKTFQLNLEEFKISWFRAGTNREEGKGKSGFEITMKNHCEGDIFEHSFNL